jgi:hypothetical protein
MSDQDPFSTDTTKQPETGAGEPATSSADPFADQLQGIKNDEGKQKYADVPSALKALEESQSFIARLLEEKRQVEQEASTTKEELSKMKTIEDFTNSLKTPDTPATNPEATPKDESKGVDEDTIGQLLEKKLAERESKDSAARNLQSVINDLSELHGDKTAEHIRNVASQLGTTPDKLKELSSENPKLAMTLLGGNKPATPVPTTSTIAGPRTIDATNPAPKWERGAARGGLTDRQLVDRFKQVQAFTNKRIGVTS